MYLGNAVLFFTLLVADYIRFHGVSGVFFLLFLKFLALLLILVFVFSGNRFPVGVHVLGLLYSFFIGFQIEVFTGEQAPFDFELFTMQTGLILISVIGLTGMKLFWGAVASIWVLLVYAATIFVKGTFGYAYLIMLVFLVLGVLINGTIFDQYQVEEDMISLVNYWKNYTSQLLSDKLPKEFHLQNATCMYVDVSGIFSYFYETESLGKVKKTLLQFIKEFQSQKQNFEILEYDENGHYWFYITENPAGSDPTYADPIADFGIKIRDFFEELCKKNGLKFSLRIGMHSGKLTEYYFDAKNSLLKVFQSESIFEKARQMEAEGVNGEIQVTYETYLLLKKNFYLTRRDMYSTKEAESGYYILNRRKE
ncbi:MAG: adenylate/guanylate cyclase domain-containing protein [Leptospiraceae bacterium]|nr:adenylate/guanylate cyclase domain-containing protein [Leptospiraceae bacterium]